MKAVLAARSRFFACFAFFLWATTGLFAVERCDCDDATSACEHAGMACAMSDDCSDCLVPSVLEGVVGEAAALFPSPGVWSVAPSLSPVFAYGEQYAIAPPCLAFDVRSPGCRPPALRAGTMCLRI